MLLYTHAIIIGIKTPGQPKRFHDDDENDNKDGCLKLSSYLLSWGCQCKKNLKPTTGAKISLEQETSNGTFFSLSIFPSPFFLMYYLNMHTHSWLNCSLKADNEQSRLHIFKKRVY